MLTEKQIAHYRTFGFVIHRELFSHKEMESIIKDFDGIMSIDRNGTPFKGTDSQTVLWFIEQRSSLIDILEDDRIYIPVEQLLGEEFLWVLSDANLFVGDTKWHGGGGTPPVLDHVKVLFYLDSLTRNTGSLRVITGSHRSEYQLFLSKYQGKKAWGSGVEESLGVAGSEIPSYALETHPGDVVFASENLWHASFYGKPGRRMFNMNIFENPTTSEQVQYIQTEQKITKAMWHPHENFLNSKRPRIYNMVKRYVELELT